MAVDVVVSGQEAMLPSELSGTKKGPEALLVFSKAFDQGHISVGRLMEVVVFPFIKLAKAINQEACSPAISGMVKPAAEVTKLLYGIWSFIVKQLLEDKFPHLLQRAKHTVLLDAMLDAKVPEVRSKVCSCLTIPLQMPF